MLQLLVSALGEMASELGGVRKLATFAFGLAGGAAVTTVVMSSLVAENKKKIDHLDKQVSELQTQLDHHDDIFGEILLPTKE